MPDHLLPSEHQIMHAIISLLQYQNYMVWRNNVGGTTFTNKQGAKRFIRFGLAGMSDIFAIEPKTGRFIAIEVKTPQRRKTVTPWQQSFLDQVNHHGGLGIIATSVAEVEEQLGMKNLLSI